MGICRKIVCRLLVAVAATSGFRSPSVAEQAAKVWTLEAAGATADGAARLSYGAPETDDTTIRFSCVPARGVMGVLILHTQRRMKRGAPAMARLGAGPVRWSIPGKIRANDESLDESFAGSAAFDPALFLRLSQAGSLQMAVGRGPVQTAPLAGSGDKFRQFADLCAKP